MSLSRDILLSTQTVQYLQIREWEDGLHLQVRYTRYRTTDVTITEQVTVK